MVPACGRWPAVRPAHRRRADLGGLVPRHVRLAGYGRLLTKPIQFCATELIEALTEIRNRRDLEIAQDHELAWEHGTLPAALLA
ncbi:hypothetical protein GCM10027601_25120 [Nocardioides ungokensis]